jgi:outer membrane immunogenic protein
VAFLSLASAKSSQVCGHLLNAKMAERIFKIHHTIRPQRAPTMNTRTILLSGVCVAALCASALAADLPAKAPYYKAPPPVPAFSWSGCYVGGNLGYGHANRTWNATATTPVTAFVSQHTSGDGFVGGGQLGCDYQAGSWVVGIEGMVDGSTINKTSGVNTIPGATLNDKVTSFETATGRIGWAMDRALLYVKGGAAWEQTSGTINGSALGLSSESHSMTNSGWVVGGGIEYAFAPQWSAKIEYNYMGFANKTVAYPITTAGTVNFTNQSLQTITAGLNYRFNWGAGPIGARY